jgi:hypothetical protein
MVRTAEARVIAGGFERGMAGGRSRKISETLTTSIECAGGIYHHDLVGLIGRYPDVVAAVESESIAAVETVCGHHRCPWRSVFSARGRNLDDPIHRGVAHTNMASPALLNSTPLAPKGGTPSGGLPLFGKRVGSEPTQAVAWPHFEPLSVGEKRQMMPWNESEK